MNGGIDTSLQIRPDKYGLPTAAEPPSSAATRKPGVLLDQYGKPYEKPETREIAPATLGGWRYYHANTIADLLAPQRLVSLIKEAEGTGDIRYLMEFFEAMEERDAHLLGLMTQRKGGVTGCRFALDPGDDSAEAERARDFCGRLLPDPASDRRVGKLTGWSARVAELLDAIAKGFACLEIVWETSEKQWLPTDLKFRPQRWWREDLVDRTKLLLLDTSAPLGMAVNPYNFIMHRHHASAGALHRGGVFFALMRPFLVRAWSLKDWLQLAEICGIPVRLGELPPGATSDDADLMWRALMSLGDAAAGMVPSGGKITFAENTRMANDGQLFDKLRERAGAEMELAILGQLFTAGTRAGASHSLGSSGAAHENVRFDLIDSDADALDETLNRQFFQPITTLNFGPDCPAPVYRTLVEEAEDLPALSKVIVEGVSVGAKIGQNYWHKKFGVPVPDEGEDLLTAPVKGAPGESPSGIESSVRLNASGGSEAKKGRTSATRRTAQHARSRDYAV